jgi:hypothetical protein
MKLKHVQMAQQLRETVVQDFIKALRGHTGRLHLLNVDFESIFSSENEEVNEKIFNFFHKILEPIEKAFAEISATESGKNALAEGLQKIVIQNEPERESPALSFEEKQFTIKLILNEKGLFYPREHQIAACLKEGL